MSTLLFCWIIGTPIGDIFPVSVGRDEVWGLVSEKIKEKQPTFNDIGASTLRLWKDIIDRSQLHLLGSEDYLKRVTATSPLDPTRSTECHPLLPNHINLIIVRRPRELLIVANYTDSYSSRYYSIYRASLNAAVPISSNDAPAKGSTLYELEELHKHFWGTDRVRRVGTVETIDIRIIPQFNPLSTNILLVRKEYRIAYDAIIAHTISMGEERSIILLTGHPGIGKTFFLLYFVFRRLQERQTIALQLSGKLFAILDERGVHPIPVNAEYFAIPKGIWTLSGSYGAQQLVPCDAFQKSKAHLLHTSSPASKRWKHWVTQLNALTYIMDVWSSEEFRTLLTVSNLPIDRGLALFHQYGSNVRTCFNFLKMPRQEETYIRNIQTAASEFARDFTNSIQDIIELDFSSKEVSSKMFTLRPKSLESRHIPTLGILTPFLLKTLALALSRDAMAQQHRIFSILNSHPTLRSPAGWMFEHMAHVFTADPGRSPLEIYIGSMKGTIPAPQRMLSGNDAIKHIQPPFNFYWRPRETNFEGVDAVICKGDHAWALQYTVSRTHRAATDGLAKVLEIMNWKKGVKWHLVMVGSASWEAESAQKSQKLTGDWAGTPVYACVVHFGVFDEQKLQQLSDLMDESTYPGEPMLEG